MSPPDLLLDNQFPALAANWNTRIAVVSWEAAEG